MGFYKNMKTNNQQPIPTKKQEQKTMSPFPYKKLDDFLPNKYKVKLQKKDRKQQLRTKIFIGSNMRQSPVNSDEEQQHQKIINKGQQWWKKVNHRFFRDLSAQELKDIREKVDGQALLQLKQPAKELQNYIDEELQHKYPQLLNPMFLKVLFRKQNKQDKTQEHQIACFNFKIYEEPRSQTTEQIGQNIHLDSCKIPPEKNLDPPAGWQNIDLQLVSTENSYQDVLKILHYDVTATENDEVDRQIILLEHQLKQTFKNNVAHWQEMVKRKQKHPLNSQLDDEILAIRRNIKMSEVLLYFKRGHSDKTEEMLDEALEIAKIMEMDNTTIQKKSNLSRLQKLQLIFQTDCKICFCTYSQDKNKVLYCDGCNTSFHQACYGVQHIGIQKFYCQVCQYLQRNHKGNDSSHKYQLKKPTCSICDKKNFPMKRINNRFYHVTCMILFNFAELKNYKISLRQGITSPLILEKVVTSQIMHDLCIFCIKDNGMKFQCSHPGCRNCYHPICAYLHGVHFQITRTFNSLTTVLTCSQHFPERSYVHQIYLRRFFCDFNNTSKLTDTQFEAKYNAEIEKRIANTEALEKERALGVLKKGKFNKPVKAPPLKGKASGSQKAEQTGKKKESQEFQMTQTRKLLGNYLK